MTDRQTQTTVRPPTFDPGEVVIVQRRSKPGYRAIVGTVMSGDYSRMTVHPLPGQGESDRARSVKMETVRSEP